MTTPLIFKDDSIQTTIDLRVYRLAAAQKAAYRLADKCTVALGTLDGDRLLVSFMFRSATPERVALDTVQMFFQELLDHELREQIGEETRPLRALIIAQAFSRTDLIRRD